MKMQGNFRILWLKSQKNEVSNSWWGQYSEPSLLTCRVMLAHLACTSCLLANTQPSITLCCGRMLCSKAKNKILEYCLLLSWGLPNPNQLQCLRICNISYFWYLQDAYQNSRNSFLELWTHLLGVTTSLSWSLVFLLLATIFSVPGLSCTVLFCPSITFCVL